MADHNINGYMWLLVATLAAISGYIGGYMWLELI